MIIKNVIVETSARYNGNVMDSKKIPTLILKLPLPGGQAIYEIDITKEQQESLEIGAKLSV